MCEIALQICVPLVGILAILRFTNHLKWEGHLAWNPVSVARTRLVRRR